MSTSTSTTQAAAHVELRNVSKSFGGVHAVRGASLVVERGEIHGLVGENGAGKSTLGKMIAGATRPSSGTILVNGTTTSHSTPRRAQASGIAMIEQELAMVPARSVLDNIFLGTESRRLGVLRQSEQRSRFTELVARSGFYLDPDARVGSLRVADQQKVEILRALARRATLIVMDEPTSPLTQVESDQLYGVMRELRAQGTTILFVTHFLEEVLAIADTVTVMRDGRIVRTAPARDETPPSLVEGMLGRSLDVAFPKRGAANDAGQPVIEVRGLSSKGRFADVSFAVRPGEILGVTGLVGSGRTEVVRAIAGADPTDGGELLLAGEPVSFRSPAEAIRSGVVMLPESRKDDGLIMLRSIAENVTLPRLDVVSGGGVMRRGAERERVRRLIDQLDVRCEGARTSVQTLSGGNQQKVLFAKWMLCDPRVFLVDEPTRGVDVGAKRAIHDLIVSLAAEGTAVVLISSDLEEVLGLAHRVVVMRRGRLVATLNAADADEQTVLTAAFGTESRP